MVNENNTALWKRTANVVSFSLIMTFVSVWVSTEIPMLMIVFGPIIFAGFVHLVLSEVAGMIEESNTEVPQN